MTITFELKERDGLGRICLLRTGHGTVTTPALMPVINPNIMAITPNDMRKEFGAEMVITNSYIIKRTEKFRERALKAGVHALLDFDGPIMTDSGAFQAYVYRDKKAGDISPEGIVEFQRDIGVDVGTILDVITDKHASEAAAAKDVDITIQRAREAVGLKRDMALAGTVQGSRYPGLRERCAKALADLDLDIHPIGGVVPFMQDYRYAHLVRAIIGAKKGLPPSRPVHLFGAGHPHVLSMAVLLGCDLFDSSSYMKYAKGDRMMFNDGTRRLEDLDHLPCHCPVCSSTDGAALRTLEKEERVLELARHNLHVLFAKIRAIRQAIHEERLWEMVERDARGHPALLEALQVIGDQADHLEGFEPISRTTAFMHTGPESRHRPMVRRYNKRLLERYTLPKANAFFVLDEHKKPFHEAYADVLKNMTRFGYHFTVRSYFGPVPIELDLMYPIAQSVSGPLTGTEKEDLLELWARLEEVNGITFEPWAKGVIGVLPHGKDLGLDLDLLRVEAVARMQFGPRAARALLDGEISLVKSRAGRIRNVLVDQVHVLSMRAHDGMYTLKVAGARKVLEATKPPLMRAVADRDAAPFILEGKNLFAKFVEDCDPGLRPGDEALITDPDDNLLAVGRLVLVREEMLSFKVGVAVKNREHV